MGDEDRLDELDALIASINEAVSDEIIYFQEFDDLRKAVEHRIAEMQDEKGMYGFSSLIEMNEFIYLLENSIKKYKQNKEK